MSSGDDETGQVDVGGRGVSFSVLGDGPPLLLLNGYAATAADWDPAFLAALATNHRVICPDARGMGGSELGDPAEPMTIASMADDAAAVLDAVGIGSAIVAGWSMGGFVAQVLAATRSERVDALVLLATDAGGPGAVRADPAVWSRLTDHSGTPREQASRLVALLFPPELAQDIDERFGEVVAEARARLLPQTLRAQERAMDKWYARTPPEPGPDAPPTWVAAGSEDIVVPPLNLELLAARWKARDAVVFDGCGHALMAQEPERAANLVAGTVSGPPPGAAAPSHPLIRRTRR